MASTDARPIPIKNTAYRVTFPILDADGDLVAGATGLNTAGTGSAISKDGGTFADVTNTVTQIATSSGMYFLDLTATEMNADCVAIMIRTTTSGAKTTPIVLYPQETGDIKVDVQSLLGTTVTTPATAGTPDVNVKQWNGLTTVALPLVPTTAGRTLDVSATGEAGLDWANIGAPTTSVALTGTTIATTQKVDIETIKTNPVVNAGTITFPTAATLASTTNITAGTITTATNLTNAPTAGDLTATMKTSVTTAATAATPTIAGTQTFNNTGTWTGNITGSVNSVTSRVTSNTDQLNGDATAAANIAKTTRAIGRGTVGTSPTLTSITTSAFIPAGAVTNQFAGRIITFDADTTTLALRGQSTDITGNTSASTPTFTVTSLVGTIQAGDTFSVT